MPEARILVVDDEANARDSLQDKITGLTLGGDDYVTKPVSPNRFSDIELDEDTHEVWKAGEPVSLSPTEFTLGALFPGRPAAGARRRRR
jgi:DNA-binding response OmpR family regulator